MSNNNNIDDDKMNQMNQMNQHSADDNDNVLECLPWKRKPNYMTYTRRQFCLSPPSPSQCPMTEDDDIDTAEVVECLPWKRQPFKRTWAKPQRRSQSTPHCPSIKSAHRLSKEFRRTHNNASTVSRKLSF